MVKSPIKTILHLSSTSGPGGAEMVVSRLAGALDGDRFHSVVCLFRPGWLNEQCERQGIETHVLPTFGRFDPKWIRNAYCLVRKGSVSVIHAHEFDAITYGSIVGILTGVPLIATVHGKNYYWERRRRRLVYRAVSRLATMVAVSEDLKAFISQNVGVGANRVKVIYNGQDLPIQVGEKECRRLRDEFGLPGTEQVVGVIGNLYPVKGHKFLIAAIPKILSAFPNTTFLFAGRGHLESTLKEEVKKCGGEKQVRFLGFREDVPALLSIMDIFVLPSLSEGLSIALLEAMGAGKAVVATNVGGNREIVIDGETGLLVPPQDPDALATKVRLLLANKHMSKKLGENGRRCVQKHFSLQTMVNKYQELYENCLQRNGR